MENKKLNKDQTLDLLGSHKQELKDFGVKWRMLYMKAHREYLKHILRETEYVIQASQNISLEEFLNNETLKRAFARSLEIIGEAVKNFPLMLNSNIPKWSGKR